MSAGHRTLQAIVWRRYDFRETSRIVALITREEGRIQVLAKGAHRPLSPFLGRLDFLNQVQVTVTAGTDRLRLLSKLTLVHEPRALRQARRYAVAAHVAEVMDHAWAEGRKDEALFDLLTGVLTLIERAPLQSLRHVLAGFELRFLRNQGLLPPFDRCSSCGRMTTVLHGTGDRPGLACAEHAEGGKALTKASLRFLAAMDQAPGRLWPMMPEPDGVEGALTWLGRWIAAAIEHKPQLRGLALSGHI